MAVFIIGDLHLSLGCKKPMDVFQGWQDYVPRLEKSWRALVAPQDTVLLAGDTSWGMKLEETLADFRFLEALPGRKVLLKGNHDYWWTTVSKMAEFFETNGLHTLSVLHNQSIQCEKENIALCGTRGWLAGQPDAHSGKVYAREVGRLRASLAHAQEHYPLAERVAVLHYPPIYAGGAAREMLDAMAQYGVKRCFYGHLHAAAIRRAVQGNVEGVEYRLISADAMQFCPYKI
ncbi:MAG: serine/threonine protein phosphatase [Oscillospiraceae bacterium]|jgi:predicted phosphohydrolase|nr:MAG: serine/threonine protein phosphatase [Oscillospiraceae bacterium]